MSNSYNSNEATKVLTELILLREDAKRVETPSLRIQILNMIAQKETRLKLLRIKTLKHAAPQTLQAPTAPPRGKERCALGVNKMKEITVLERR
jgi:hypothetical protein